MTTEITAQAEIKSWSFEVLDPTYRGWKTVVVEGTNRATAQRQLHEDGYARVRASRRRS